jgi:cytochrome c biogenesis protein CcmG/thiol:disulfide interchange protein DsbE
MTHKGLAGPLMLWAALLVLGGAGVCSGAGNPAPDFTLPNLQAKDVALSELLKNGPVIVDFWATWCKPCVKAFPELQEVFDNYKDCGLQLLAISIDGPKSASRVAELVKSRGNTFEVLLDPGQQVARKFHVTSVPRTVLIDKNGQIVYAVTGYRPTNRAELEKAVGALFPSGCAKKTSPGESK